MTKKYTQDFDSLYESYFSRYTAGCFGPGDVIEFDPALLKDQAFRQLPPDQRDQIQGMIEASANGDAIVAVSSVDVNRLETFNVAAPSTITIAYSQGGARFYGQVTLPGSLGQYMKRVGSIHGKLPKHAIKIHHGGIRQPVDTDSIKAAWKQSAVTDSRLTKSESGDVDQEI